MGKMVPWRILTVTMHQALREADAVDHTSFEGTCILFFGYDSAVMSQVNTNPDYIEHMNINRGTNGDAARVGGLVTFWFAGFFIGKQNKRTLDCSKTDDPSRR